MLEGGEEGIQLDEVPPMRVLSTGKRTKSLDEGTLQLDRWHVQLERSQLRSVDRRYPRRLFGCTREVRTRRWRGNLSAQEDRFDRIVVAHANPEYVVLVNAHIKFSGPQRATPELVWVAALRKEQIPRS
jgi:hypothetical protein